MKRRTRWILAGVAAAAALAGVGVGVLLVNIQERKAEGRDYPLRVVAVGPDELDPAVWGKNFPRHYDSFRRTRLDYGRTPYGGSAQVDELEENRFLRTAWAGYAFSVEYNAARGHHYALIDQKESRRVTEFSQPAACLNCHAAEAPRLVEELGWEGFHRHGYDELADRAERGTSCADCHEPGTMELRITRRALVEGMAARGIDVTEASRQEMRTYVCAQCHVEYYFRGPDRVLTFPWSRGLSVDSIEAHYDAYGFTDWTHEITGAPMLKMQHPEFELSRAGIHARSGVACADCHMPYTREGGVKVSDHWIRSPLTSLANACQTCHRVPEEELRERVVTIQDRTAEMLRRTEAALDDAIGAIASAREAGASDEALAEARRLHRRSQTRWDFVFSENSTGFHAPQEAARILGASTDLARQAQLFAERAARAASASQVAASASQVAAP